MVVVEGSFWLGATQVDWWWWRCGISDAESLRVLPGAHGKMHMQECMRLAASWARAWAWGLNK